MNTEIELTTLNIDIPAWIDQDLDTSQVEAILEGGCASGAYMPAVTYHQAIKTMSEHGDDVLQYIEDTYGELPAAPQGTSWSGMACHHLSMAVELWANATQDEITAKLRTHESETQS